MPTQLPTEGSAIARVTWTDLEPHYAALEAVSFNDQNVAAWLADWSRVERVAREASSRLSVATTVNTADTEAEAALNVYLDELYPQVSAAGQRLKEKLLASGVVPADFEIPLRNMRAEAALFREANLPLLGEEQKLGMEYDKITGAQTVTWEGEEKTLAAMGPLQTHADRNVREEAWRLTLDRWQQDRADINALWARFLTLRLQIAENAGFGNDFRAYTWQRFQRFDYSPDNCREFQAAIETVVKPAAARVLERRRQRLGLETLRPWDLAVDTSGQPPLKPFATDTELSDKTAAIFAQLDTALSQFFTTMQRDGLLDLGNRMNKAGGGYCTDFAVAGVPFIFMNAVGLHSDVQTMLHEAGHAFHVFESAHLPYVHQQNVNTEFAEVASMSMELLSAPYLSPAFYTPAEAARARIEHLEHGLLFWPYMAVVDAFQHWVYENPTLSVDAAECDAEWSRQWDRFMPVVDWTGLEAEKATGWHRKLHIHQIPFYYVEYGLAQLGAYQVFANSLDDAGLALTQYRSALALGGTKTLPDLFAAAGAKFAFDAETLTRAVNLIEATIEQLSS